METSAPHTAPLLSLDPPVIWAGVWAVGFCFLANQWHRSPPRYFLLGSNSAKAAITFSFFSILVWVRRAPVPPLLPQQGRAGRCGLTGQEPTCSQSSPRPPQAPSVSWANGEEGPPPSSRQTKPSFRECCPRPPPQPAPASLELTLLCLLIFQAYLAFQELRNDAPVPYKRSLDEGGVVLTSLSPPSAASPVNTPTTGPHGPSYASSSLSPYLSTPKAPRLAMMPDN